MVLLLPESANSSKNNYRLNLRLILRKIEGKGGIK